MLGYGERPIDLRLPHGNLTVTVGLSPPLACLADERYYLKSETFLIMILQNLSLFLA